MPRKNNNARVKGQPVTVEYLISMCDTSGGSTACWPWLGTKTAYGYGTLTINKKFIAATRAYWQLKHGVELSRNTYVCHRCDNPACLNPAHLFLGTQADNMRDMSSKGRAWRQSDTHCKRGHEFNEQNTSFKELPSGKIRRTCRICCNAKTRERYKVQFTDKGLTKWRVRHPEVKRIIKKQEKS